MDEIRPTGALRAWGWSLLPVGVLTLLIVWPLFLFGGATDQGETKGLLTFIGTAAPFVGLALIGTSVALLVTASKRAAANREAAQRAVLRQP